MRLHNSEASLHKIRLAGRMVRVSGYEKMATVMQGRRNGLSMSIANEEQRPEGKLLVYQGQGQDSPIQVRLEGDTVWLTQRLLAELYGSTVVNITQHISSIYEDEELLPEATIRRYRIVQTEGGREVVRLVDSLGTPSSSSANGMQLEL